MRKVGPVLGDVLVGEELNGVQDCLRRIEWLKVHAPENVGALKDAEHKLAIARERENHS